MPDLAEFSLQPQNKGEPARSGATLAGHTTKAGTLASSRKGIASPTDSANIRIAVWGYFESANHLLKTPKLHY